MYKYPKVVVAYLALFASTLPSVQAAEKPDQLVNLTIWRNPGNVASRDLFYGAGGEQHAPGSGPYVFLEEDRDGASPKFVVKDSQGVKWKVKVGPEARSETVATRLVWAVGYPTDEDYFTPFLRVDNMPLKLYRGAEHVSPEGWIHEGRWERMGYEKIGQWRWGKNPFDDTRELNGLRVVMALLNNWDLKDSQNSIYQREGVREYVVSDLGATFGQTGASWPTSSAKGDLEKYSRSDFITKTTDEYVNFKSPSWPMMAGVIPTPPLPYPWITAPVKLFGREPAPDNVGQMWIGRGVPLEHVRWIAGLLGQLTPKQIRDAFRAAHYSPEEVEGFALVVEKRIAQLSEL